MWGHHTDLDQADPVEIGAQWVRRPHIKKSARNAYGVPLSMQVGLEQGGERGDPGIGGIE